MFVPSLSPDVPLNGYSGEVGSPPLSLTVGPGEQSVPQLGKLLRRMLRNLLPVDLIHTRKIIRNNGRKTGAVQGAFGQHLQ